MAHEGAFTCIPGAVALSDLSSTPNRFVSMAASGMALTDTGLLADGVLLNEPNALGVAAEVAFSGVVKVEAGDTVTAGQFVTSDSTGRAIPAVAGGSAVAINGKALSGGAVGNLITVLLNKGYIKAT